MENTNIDWTQLSDVGIMLQIGHFIKKTRLQQNITQAQLANMSGLNRWTISKVEKGEAVSLSSLIPILRAMDVLYVFNHFEVQEEISPLAYAKLKKKEKIRARNKGAQINDEEDLGW